jgi:hypothetical protein
LTALTALIGQVKLLSTQIQNSPPLVPGAGSLLTMRLLFIAIILACPASSAEKEGQEDGIADLTQQATRYARLSQAAQQCQWELLGKRPMQHLGWRCKVIRLY